ncbi:MAG: hypothetical protein ACUVXI_05220 [bacterium]
MVPVGQSSSVIRLAVENPMLWSPDEPHLYDLNVSVETEGKINVYYLSSGR